jgi:hypothetical protein
MEQPYGLVDFVQQTGRGRRRERKMMESMIVMDKREAWFREQSSDVEHLNRQTMK